MKYLPCLATYKATVHAIERGPHPVNLIMGPIRIPCRNTYTLAAGQTRGLHRGLDGWALGWWIVVASPWSSDMDLGIMCRNFAMGYRISWDFLWDMMTVIRFGNSYGNLWVPIWSNIVGLRYSGPKVTNILGLDSWNIPLDCMAWNMAGLETTNPILGGSSHLLSGMSHQVLTKTQHFRVGSCLPGHCGHRKNLKGDEGAWIRRRSTARFTKGIIMAFCYGKSFLK